MQRSPRAIFLFSLEPWGDMWYSKHHYAAFLAKSFPVYFISLPDRWRWTDLFSMSARVRTVKEGVHVVEYRNNLPLRLLPAPLERLMNRLNAWKLRRLVPSSDLLLWCFHPAAVVESAVLRRPGTKVVYHVVDPYQGLSNDSSFARSSDMVAAINPWYLQYYSRLNDTCLLIPHGVRAEDRTPRPAQVSYYQEQWGTYAIMAAGLNYRTNYAADRTCPEATGPPVDHRRGALRHGPGTTGTTRYALRPTERHLRRGEASGCAAGHHPRRSDGSGDL